jgi:hypothetical protein
LLPAVHFDRLIRDWVNFDQPSLASKPDLAGWENLRAILTQGLPKFKRADGWVRLPARRKANS